MRFLLLALTATAALLAGIAPASADSGWEPAPSAPWELPAGARCDAPISGVPIVDEVEKRVLETNPDGTPKTELYRGDLVIRVTNLDTGAFFDADASGKAFIEYGDDGSQHWSVIGPVFVGFAEDGGTMPRGVYVIDGVYTLDIAADGYKTVAMTHGTTDDICARIE